MSRRYCYDYPRPAVTVDLVAFALLGESLRVLLVRRKHDPYAGRWALPGGFLEMEEPIEAAAKRELREESGLKLGGPIAFLGVYGAPGRDPRGRTITIAHVATVRGPLPKVQGGDDAADAAWLDPAGPLALAFDHDAILADARAWLDRAVAEGPAVLALLPREFDVNDVARLHRALGKPARSASTWWRRRLRAGEIVPIPESEDRYQGARR